MPDTPSLQKHIIRTQGAPRLEVPANQAVAVEAGSCTLYISGQLPFDPSTCELVGAGNVELQTLRVLDNMDAILQAAGMTFDNLVKVCVWLTAASDYERMNHIYRQRFTDYLPARKTILGAILPRGHLVEMDGIAVR